MKRILSIILILTQATAVFAQLPVSTAPEKKNVVIEEYTGIHCGNCPLGHKMVNQLEKDHPGDVFGINIHTGSFATGKPDLRTPFGDGITSIASVTGYPAASVNRIGPSTTIGSNVGNPTRDIITKDSYVNIAFQSNVNSTTREMTIDVEIYFTAKGANSVNLNIAVLQDNIEGYQEGKSGNPDQVLPNGMYNHLHVFRDLVTGQWGEAITTTNKGELVKKQYKYTIPADIRTIPLVIKDIHLVAFIAEGKTNIITASTGPITIDGTTNINEVNKLINQVIVYPNPSNSISNVDFTLKSTENMALKVSNVIGEVVYSTKVDNLSAGKHIFPIDVTKLNTGIYFVNLSIGNEQITRKINVVK
ncbi:MAG: Omp28-related outer membrane protein [Bacteroidia bacterium]